MKHRGRNDYAIGGIAMLPIEIDTAHPGCHIYRLKLQFIKLGKPLNVLIYWKANLKP